MSKRYYKEKRGQIKFEDVLKRITKTKIPELIEFWDLRY
jgi:hypothetical protein